MKLGVLVPRYNSEPGHPADRPIGRAALRLEAEGATVIFGHEAQGGRLSGVRATPQGWVPALNVPIKAAYDRFPSRTLAADYAALRAGLEGVPLGNPPALVKLCADKLRCQQVLTAAGLPMPPVATDPARFAQRLQAWGVAYLKPRYGAYGRGVQQVRPGAELPDRLEGAVLGELEPTFLQRAVPPPRGWRGVAVRALTQRTGPDTWHVAEPVARRSRTDPVVNASRGAEVTTLKEAVPQAVETVRALAVHAARALAAQPQGALLVEVGVDACIDDQGKPWIVEVNSRPRGRLEWLARQDPARYGEIHVEACARPLRYLLQR